MSVAQKRFMKVVSILLAVVLITVVIMAVSYRRMMDDTERLRDLGDRYLQGQNYELALTQFQRLIEIEPLSARGYYGSARAYVGLGRLDEAIDILRVGFDRTGDPALREFQMNVMAE